jgi:hypothetical protein
MARYVPDTDRLTLEEQIKTLADKELLDFWEETQYLAKMLEHEDAEPPEGVSYDPEYERLILQELQVRSTRMGLKPQRR